MRAFLTSALITAWVAAGAAASGRAQWTPLAAGGATAPPAFRLGDAAQPFGWATAVADFNTDGKPDAAIADRIGGPFGHAFRLEFAISGQAANHVTFESAHDAITIRVADVDRDNDLDVVVGTPFSTETVAVWLNDGHGHFSEAVTPPASASWGSASTVDASGENAAADALDISRRANDAVASATAEATVCAPQRALVLRASRARSAPPSPRTSPRAPPSPLL